MNNSPTDLIDEVKARLAARFDPTLLDIQDESAKHAGHAGAQDGMHHLSLKISSAALDALPNLLAHKEIYGALGELMQTRIHALRIRVIKS